jgi:hypothetical protein
MATASKIGRNEPCPCGSGKKYKACCATKKQGMSPLQWLAIAAIGIAVAAALVALAQDAREGPSASVCPPGQVWSVEHGHCH